MTLQKTLWHARTLILITLCLAPYARPQEHRESDWPNYGNDPGGMRHSSLTQINRQTVAKLKVAWIYHTSDISDGHDGKKRSAFETTPILVDGMLFLTTPFNRVIAVDPATGRGVWSYDPKIDQTLDYGDGLVNRGVATWLDPSRNTEKPCRRRIFEATLDARLIALDASTGRLCADFGSAGQINLRDSSDYQHAGLGEYMRGWYHMTSPPVTIDDVVIVGSAIDDNIRADMPSGVVRAFDARTGALRWKWDPIRKDPQNATSSWLTGAANAWSIMARRQRTRFGFCSYGERQPRLFRRPAPRRRQVGEFRRCSRCKNWKSCVGIPVSPPRSLGLRHRVPATPRHNYSPWQKHSCRYPGK